MNRIKRNVTTNGKIEFDTGYKKWGIRGGCLYNWKDKRVLIIDNDELNCRMLTTFLRSTQVVIDHLFDPLKIKDYNHVPGKYDLILMEIYLCDTNGIMLLENILQSDPHLPVIVQSVLTTPDYKSMCFNAGCAAYFTKPLDIKGMLEVMDGVLKSEQAKERGGEDAMW